MDSRDIPEIQEAEGAPSAQGKVAGQAGTPAVAGAKTRSKGKLAATPPAKTGQGPPPRAEQEQRENVTLVQVRPAEQGRENDTLAQAQLEEFAQLPTHEISASQQELTTLRNSVEERFDRFETTINALKFFLQGDAETQSSGQDVEIIRPMGNFLPKVEWEYRSSGIVYPFTGMTSEGIPEDFARIWRSKKTDLTIETKQTIKVIAHARFYAQRVSESIARCLDSDEQSQQASLALLRSIRQELEVDSQAAPPPEAAPGTVAVRPALRSAPPPLLVALNGYADAALLFPPGKREMAYIRATRWVDTESSGFSETSREQALQDARLLLRPRVGDCGMGCPLHQLCGNGD